MGEYELTIIFSPYLTEEKIDAIIEKLRVKIKSKDFWGKRVFSYPLLLAGRHGGGHKEGIYVMMKVELISKEVGEVERKLRLEEKVLRYLLVKSQ